MGKRRKQRTVPVSRATIAALRAHWRDRGNDFDAAGAHGPLIAPTWIPGTPAAIERHDVRSDQSDEQGRAQAMPYTVDALGRIVRMAMQRLSVQTPALADFSAEDLVQLAHTSAHAFRHYVRRRTMSGARSPPMSRSLLGSAVKKK